MSPARVGLGRRENPLTAFFRELRFSSRSLAKTPGFSLVAILILALGIGVTTAMFGVVRAVLFAPLGLRGEDRLVRLRDFLTAPDGRRELSNTSAASFEAIRDQNKVFEMVAAWNAGSRTIPGPGGEAPERISVVRVFEGLSKTVGVTPILGRDFTPAEERAGADARVVQISHSLWQRRFGGQRAALGERLSLDRVPFTVVGVLAPGFRFPYDADAWTPDRMLPSDEPAVFARLKRGVSLDRAQGDLATIAARLKGEHPEMSRGFGMEAIPARRSLAENEERIAIALLVVVGFFLLLACADVASLFLARAVTRRREAAIRAALGADRRGEILRALAEALSLSLPAAAAGVLLAGWLAPAISVLIPDNLRLQLGVSAAASDARILVFALGLAGMTALLCALIPALRVSATGLDRILRETGRGAEGGRETNRLLSALVVGEMALALVLLTGAALFVSHLDSLRRRDLGIVPEKLLTVRVALPLSRYAGGPERVFAVSEILSAISRTPGVAAAGVTTVNPLRGGTWVTPVEVEGVAAPDSGSAFVANYRLISPDLFRAMGIPVLSGQDFDPRDTQASSPVAIVSLRLARHFWPRQSALERRVRFGRASSVNPWRTVVGVVGDVEDAGEVREAWYLPYAQRASTDGAEEINLMVRASCGSAGALARLVRLAIARVDPDLAAFDAATMEAVRADSVSRERFGAGIASVAAGLGVLISALGIAGLVSYRVAQERMDTAIRLALGALGRQIVARILWQGGRVVLAGLLLGAVGALVLDRVLRHLVPGLEGSGLTLLPGLVLLLGLVALLALAVPAVRAAGTDPTASLRA